MDFGERHTFPPSTVRGDEQSNQSVSAIPKCMSYHKRGLKAPNNRRTKISFDLTSNSFNWAGCRKEIKMGVCALIGFLEEQS